MKISQISHNNFGAIPDIETRNLLKKANLKGIDTSVTEDLMKEIYADKYIITHKDPSNVTYIDLCNKEYGVATLFANLLTYCDKDFSNQKAVVDALQVRLQDLAQKRSKEQKIIDRIENKFGRYDEIDAYESRNGYSARIRAENL